MRTISICLVAATLAGCVSVQGLREEPAAWTKAYPGRVSDMAKCTETRILEDVGGGASSYYHRTEDPSQHLARITGIVPPPLLPVGMVDVTFRQRADEVFVEVREGPVWKHVFSLYTAEPYVPMIEQCAHDLQQD